MFRFTIRDVLWLMVVVGLSASWWIDNKRIEAEVAKLAGERRSMKADWDDRLQVLDETQKKASQRLLRSARFGQ
jgi:hypothetical protein